jgi:hypothetical protein
MSINSISTITACIGEEAPQIMLGTAGTG